MQRVNTEVNCKPGSVPQNEAAIINLGLPLPTGSSSQPESSDGPSSNAFLFDLAPDRVYQAIAVTNDTGELLPLLFTIAAARKFCRVGCVFSAALSLGSPPLRVTEYPALWSPDFPPSQ